MPTEEEVFLHWSTSSWSSSTSSSWSSCPSSSSSSSWCRGSASGGDGVGDVPRLASRLAPAGRWNRRPAVSFSLSVSHSTHVSSARESLPVVSSSSVRRRRRGSAGCRRRHPPLLHHPHHPFPPPFFSRLLLWMMNNATISSAVIFNTWLFSFLSLSFS